MSNPSIEKVRNILIPVLDEFVTDSAIKVNCERIGVTEDTLTIRQLSKFAEKIKITLLLFLEEEKIEKIVQEIKNLKIEK